MMIFSKNNIFGINSLSNSFKMTKEQLQELDWQEGEEVDLRDLYF